MRKENWDFYDIAYFSYNGLRSLEKISHAYQTSCLECFSGFLSSPSLPPCFLPRPSTSCSYSCHLSPLLQMLCSHPVSPVAPSQAHSMLLDVSLLLFFCLLSSSYFGYCHVHLRLFNCCLFQEGFSEPLSSLGLCSMSCLSKFLVQTSLISTSYFTFTL